MKTIGLILFLFVTVARGQSIFPAAFMGAPLAAAAGGGGDVTSGLVSRYLFNGTVNDSVGSANGTAFNSPTYITNHKAITSGAILFDGSSQYATASPYDFTGTHNYTVCGWFKEVNGTSYGRMISGESSGNNGFLMGAWGGGNADFDIYSIHDTSTLVLPYSALSGGVGSTWNFICITYDGTTFSQYVNGAFYSSLTTTASSAATSFLSFGAGASGEQHWNGAMDTVSIYNRALSGTEVTNLFNFEK